MLRPNRGGSQMMSWGSVSEPSASTHPLFISVSSHTQHHNNHLTCPQGGDECSLSNKKVSKVESHNRQSGTGNWTQQRGERDSRQAHILRCIHTDMCYTSSAKCPDGNKHTLWTLALLTFDFCPPPHPRVLASTGMRREVEKEFVICMYICICIKIEIDS